MSPSSLDSISSNTILSRHRKQSLNILSENKCHTVSKKRKYCTAYLFCLFSQFVCVCKCVCSVGTLPSCLPLRLLQGAEPPLLHAIHTQAPNIHVSVFFHMHTKYNGNLSVCTHTHTHTHTHTPHTYTNTGTHIHTKNIHMTTELIFPSCFGGCVILRTLIIH